MINIGFCLLGLIISFIIFYNIKVLKDKNNVSINVSVIIPAKNEGLNLANLLEGLNNQSVKAFEIIVVNDQSSDDTEKIAESFGAKVVNIYHKPDGWSGKNYACYSGAQSAKGEVLLFLDADVLVEEHTLQLLMENYDENSVLSVQPYHYTKKLYEQFSLFFNAVAIAAVGVAYPRNSKTIGLFGPVIMISKALYHSFDGHRLVAKEVIEDLELGTLLRKKGIKCDLYMGFGSISYQMYKGGFKDLIWGWSKNFSAAAVKTPLLYITFVVLWLNAYYIIAIELIANVLQFLNGGDFIPLLISFVLCLIAGLILFKHVRKIGSFTLISCLLYLIPLLGFSAIFIFSIILKVVIRRIYWKGRWYRI